MKALELADAYADACFDQALNGRTEDPIPEQKRDELAAELRRLAAVESELERIKALEPVAWANPNDMVDVETSFRWICIGDFTEPVYALGSKT